MKPDPAATHALITGAGRGIGRATALAFAALGCRVSLLARSADQLENVAGEITTAGGQAKAIVCDATDPAQVERAIAEAREAFGPVGVLVNNAGVVARAPLVDNTDQMYDSVMDANMRGTFLLTRAILPDMIAAGGGRIINLSSIAANSGSVPGFAVYCAAKGAIKAFTRSLAGELAPRGIQVNAVAPGSVDTQMLREGIPGAEPAMQPEDIADIIVHLAFEAPDAVTGTEIEAYAGVL